ncbi:MAG: hypothetical protein IJA34_08490 [Lachnospiraceae bacterium]|nr:hypothetical protein [Lachnospiraceae bacterium]
MDKIIKCFYILTIIIGSIFLSINVVKNNKNVDFVSTYNSENKNNNIEYVTIQEIRDTLEEVIKELEDGKYTNLIADDIYASVSSEDEVCEMREYSPGLYHGITDPIEMYNMQMDLIHFYLGEDLLDEWIVDGNALYWNKEGGASVYEHKVVLEKLEQGKYDEICIYPPYGYALPSMSYCAAGMTMGEDNREMILTADFTLVHMNKGKYLDTIKELCPENIREEFDLVATYYPNSKNLDDVYELLNGEISIKDAIEYVEDYFKNQLPYDISIGPEKKVVKVDVYEIIEGLYYFEFQIVRVINGLETEYGSYEYNLPYGKYTDEICTAIMIDIDDIDWYVVYGNTLLNEKKGDSVEKVVSLKSALQLVSNQIGKNSVYEVIETKMAYRREIINDKCQNYNEEYEGKPCWIIICENQVDGSRTVFYINLINGQLDYQVLIS